MKRVISLLAFAAIFLLQAYINDSGKVIEALPGNYVSSIYAAEDGKIYFATDKGLSVYDGDNWTTVTTELIHDLDLEQLPDEAILWLGTNQGISLLLHPVDAAYEASVYASDDTRIVPDHPGLAGDSVFVVRIDDRNIRWFGTNEGLSALREDQWPVINLNRHYTDDFFRNNRITAIDYSNDTVYIGTHGGGIARMVTGETDAITGASPYDHPYSMLPSRNILAVYADGSDQWFGSDEGLVRHTGIDARINWTQYFESDGLVNNYVQSINKDLTGNIWFGTKGGVSSFDGASWTNYTTDDGLVSNNVLSIAIDHQGNLWFGTDNGVSRFDGSTWASFQASN